MLTLYLAGPITDFPEFREAFAFAERVVARAGHRSVSPLDIYAGEDWLVAMRLDITELMKVDGIVLLPGWPRSKGARLELTVAAELKKRIFMLADDQLVEVTSPMVFQKSTAAKAVR